MFPACSWTTGRLPRIRPTVPCSRTAAPFALKAMRSVCPPDPFSMPAAASMPAWRVIFPSAMAGPSRFFPDAIPIWPPPPADRWFWRERCGRIRPPRADRSPCNPTSSISVDNPRPRAGWILPRTFSNVAASLPTAWLVWAGETYSVKTDPAFVLRPRSSPVPGRWAASPPMRAHPPFHGALVPISSGPSFPSMMVTASRFR